MYHIVKIIERQNNDIILKFFERKVPYQFLEISVVGTLSCFLLVSRLSLLTIIKLYFLLLVRQGDISTFQITSCRDEVMETCI